jgi:low affinity Fe/Cu permease
MSDREMSKIELIGCRVSEWVSDLFANPFTQIAVIAFCVIWFSVGLPTDLLTAALSILAITLTQMVLNRQIQREANDHRRDVALHAKLDELIIAKRGARDEMAGIEELDEETIVDLREAHQGQVEDLDEALEGRKKKAKIAKR